MIHLWKDLFASMAKPPWLAAPATMQEMTLPHRGTLTGWRIPLGAYGPLAPSIHTRGFMPIQSRVKR